MILLPPSVALLHSYPPLLKYQCSVVGFVKTIDDLDDSSLLRFSTLTAWKL